MALNNVPSDHLPSEHAPAFDEDDLLRRSASVAGDDDEPGDPLEQLLDAYHFHFEPEIRFKIKQR